MPIKCSCLIKSLKFNTFKELDTHSAPRGKINTNLDCFLRGADLDVDRRGDEVERENFLRSAGDRDFDNCFFCTGDAETEGLL